MALDLGVVLGNLGEAALAEVGAPVGLDAAKTREVGEALAAHWDKGPAEAVQAAAADTNLTEDVVTSVLEGLTEAGAEAMMQNTPVGDAVEAAKAQAAAVLGPAGGVLGRLFGRKG